MTRSKAIWTLLVVGVAIVLTVGGSPAKAVKKPAAAEAGKPADLLAKKLKKVEFSGVPLEEVVEYLRDMTGVNIVVKWKALEAAGIKKATPVDLKVKDVPVEKVLRLVLDSVGRERDHLDYDYELEDNIVTISTAEDLSWRTVARVYDVRELIDWADPKRVESLLDLVRTTIEPDTWRENTGMIGSVRHLNGVLVVTHTSKVHEALVVLLEYLRAAHAKPLTSPRARAQQTDVKIQMVGSMKQTCMDPGAMALIAVAGLRDEVPRGVDEVIKEFEDLLVKIKSLGIRNAIRLGLKDLYKLKGENEKVLHHLRQMLIENARGWVVKKKDAVSSGLFGGG